MIGILSLGFLAYIFGKCYLLTGLYHFNTITRRKKTFIILSTSSTIFSISINKLTNSVWHIIMNGEGLSFGWVSAWHTWQSELCSRISLLRVFSILAVFRFIFVLFRFFLFAFHRDQSYSQKSHGYVKKYY